MTNHIDPSKFAWADLNVAAPHCIFRQLFSQHLLEHIGNIDGLDNPITGFGYVPCTQIYSLGDSEEKIYAFICIGTNLIDTIGYDSPDGRSIELRFSDRDNALVIKAHTEDFKEKETTFVHFEHAVYNDISRVNQELLDSLRIECDGKIVTKDGEIV